MGTSNKLRIFFAMNLDADVGYALAARVITAGGQLVTLGLLAFFMAPEVQGYHFTFLSFAALQSFFELGFYIVVVNTAAHESAQLSSDPDGGLTGADRHLDRLASLLRLSMRWYGYVSIAFVVFAMIGGWIFFSARPADGVAWQTPWVVLVLAAGLQMWSNSALYFLEGCNRVSDSYRVRVVASLAGQGASWFVLALGGNLWVAASAIGIAAGLQLALAVFGYRNLFRPLLARSVKEGISWESEMWPLQWRMAAQGIAGYFFLSIFTPLALHYHGPVDAGRVGLSWALANGVLPVTGAWLQARAPRLAALVAQGKDDELHDLFRRTVLACLITMAVALAILWTGLRILQDTGIDVAHRFLPAESMAWLFAGALLLQASSAMSVYFRAHKADPSTPINVAVAAIGAVVIWGAAAFYGPGAMALGYFFVIAALLIPCQTVVFFRYRSIWHPALS